MELQVGDKAPSFEGKNEKGETISLKDFDGKRLILFFYPKDDTSVCTVEACNFRDNYLDLAAKGFEVVGVSVDDEKSHQKFVNKYDLPYNLIADVEKEIVNKYGVWGEKSMYGNKYMGTMRTTFVISAKGTIEAIIEKVKSKEASQQVLKVLSA